MPPRTRTCLDFEQADAPKSKNEAKCQANRLGSGSFPVVPGTNAAPKIILRWTFWFVTPGESGGGPPQSKTLARWPVMPGLREASWSAPALWRFGTGGRAGGEVRRTGIFVESAA
jgi:hypothetical protein